MKSKLGRTLVIANPAAHSGKGAGAADFVERFLQSYGNATSGFKVVRTGRPGDARRHASKAAGYDTVIALGGDGVIHDVVNGLMAVPKAKRPRLGVIPMGSGNDYGRTLHLALNDPMASLGQVTNGTPVALDLGEVNGEYFCETCSFGLDAAIALDTMETRTRNGLAGTRLFAQSGYRILSEHSDGWHYEMRVDGGPRREGREIVFACQVGPTYGGGFKICPEASPVDGMLDLCRNMRIPGRAETLALFTGTRFGMHAGSSAVEISRFSRLRVEFDEEPPAQVDGEPLHGTVFDVRCEPGALEVLVPNSFEWHPDPVRVERPSVTEGLLGSKLAGKLRGRE